MLLAALRVMLVITLMIFATSPARASWLSVLKSAGTNAGSSVVTETAERALKLRPGSGLLNMSDGSELTFTTLTATGIATVSYSSIDDLITGLKSVVGDIIIPEDILHSSSTLVKRLVDEKPIASKVIDENGAVASLTLRTVGDVSELTIRVSQHITMSPAAWSSRALLDQKLMAGLLGRMKVIALVPTTDQIQRNLLKNKFGSKVRFVEDLATLDTELKRANKRFTVVLGHVENDSYVLRNAANEVVVKKPLQEVETILDSNRSVALLMGCRVACTPSMSGPIEVIDGIRMIQAISNNSHVSTPMQFIEAVAKSTGPMHVEEDLLGRMRVVNSSYLSKTELVVQTTSPLARIFISHRLSHPLSVEHVFTTAIYFVYIATFMVLLSWPLLLFFGLTPRRAWNLSKELYASVCFRDDDRIDDLNRIELVVLFVVTPTIFILSCIPGIIITFTNILVSPIAMLFGIFLNFFGLSDRKQLTGEEDKHVGLLPRWANAAVPASFIILLGLIASTFISESEILYLILPEKLHPNSFFVTSIVISAIVIIVSKKIPILLSVYTVFLFILASPILLLMSIARFILILPLTFLVTRILRIQNGKEV